jgi:hypothetical protein
MSKRTSLYDIPSEIISKIMVDLPYDTKLHLGSMCRHFRDAFMDFVDTVAIDSKQLSLVEQNKITLPFRNLKIIYNGSGVVDISWIYQFNLNSINIDRSKSIYIKCEHVWIATLILPTIIMPHLKILKAENNGHVCYDNLDSICPNLEELSIICDTDINRKFPLLPKLNKLTIEFVRYCSDDIDDIDDIDIDISDIDLENLRHIPLLDLNSVYHRYEGNGEEIVTYCGTLERLTTVWGIEDIVFPTSLKYMCLELVDDGCIPELHDYENLTTLILILDDTASDHWDDHDSLYNIPINIKHLKLCDNINITTLDGIPITIKYLNIRCDDGISLRPMIDMKKLKYIELRMIGIDNDMIHILNKYATRYNCRIIREAKYTSRSWTRGYAPDEDIELCYTIICKHPNISEYIELCYREYDLLHAEVE